MAKELGLGIAPIYQERWDGPPCDTVSLIDRHGAIVLTYATVHPCAFSWECARAPSNDVYVCALDTARGRSRAAP